jgi:hypothetical protein
MRRQHQAIGTKRNRCAGPVFGGLPMPVVEAGCAPGLCLR